MQTYHAKSIFNSKTFWTNVALFLIAVLELSEVTNVVPAAWQGSLLAIAAILNVALRIFTVRPAAMVAPGKTKGIRVKSI